MRVLASAPQTRTLLCAPLSTILTPACKAYTNPEQPAETSKPQQFDAPILCCTREAVLGYIMSGVTVPTMMTSTSFGEMPRAARHFLAASAHISLTPLPAASLWRV